MPFPMKVLPLDGKEEGRIETASKTAGKSRLKRLFERSLLRTSSAGEKLAAAGRDREDIDPEPNSVCLDSMVLSFMESGNEKPSRCGFGRCNCFNCEGSSSDDDIDPPPTVASGDAAELLKGLVPCVNISERNLLADATGIADRVKGRSDFQRAVAEELRSAGYDAAVCKSRWEKGAAFPAGEYEYIDVLTVADGGEEEEEEKPRRMIVDVDFRSEFEIARSTKAYRAVLQALPSVFVGSGERLEQIVAVVSEAARVSLRKKGLHFPPWRNPEYMRSKWLGPYERDAAAAAAAAVESHGGEGEADGESGGGSMEVVAPWQPPPVRRKAAVTAGARVVTGLASVMREKV